MAADHVKPFTLLAELFTRSEEKASEEIALLKGVGEFESQQQACGAYLVLQPLEGDKTHLTVFEAYDNKDYLLNDHRNSDAYKKLASHAETANTRSAPVSASFSTPHVGWLQRSSPSTIPVGEQFIWLAKLKAHPGKRDEILKLVRTHTANVERTEEGTLSFLVLESKEDADALVLFERYVSEEYFRETHFTSASMKEYREKMGPFLAERESAGFRGVAGFVDKRETLP